MKHDSESDRLENRLRRAGCGALAGVLALAGAVGVAAAAPLAQAAPGASRSAAPPAMPPEPPATPALPATPASPAAAPGMPGRTGAMMHCGPDTGSGRGLKAADTDGDGKISRAEFMQHHQAMFEQLPKDRNGLVSVEDAMREGGMMGPGDPAKMPGMKAPAGERRPAVGSSPGSAAGPATDSAASGSSSPSSTPSSTAPQDAKPGR